MFTYCRHNELMHMTLIVSFLTLIVNYAQDILMALRLKIHLVCNLSDMLCHHNSIKNYCLACHNH